MPRRCPIFAFCVALIYALGLSSCRPKFVSNPIEPNRQLLSALLSQNPTPVNVSPNGVNILAKTRHESDFEILVLDRASQLSIASDRSPNTQLSLTWSPDSSSIAFQEAKGGNRQYELFVFDLASKRRHRVRAPLSDTAAPPIRWNPSGRGIAYFAGAGGSNGPLLWIDPNNSSPPSALIDSIARDGDFVWSADGQKIAAAATEGSGTIAIANAKTHARETLFLGNGARIRDLVWAPDGRSLLASVRLRGSEFLQLYEVHLMPFRVVLRASHQGDVSSPLWLPIGGSFVYHLNQHANIVPCLGTPDGLPGRTLGFTNGIYHIERIIGGNRALMMSKSALEPNHIDEIDLADHSAIRLFPQPSGTNGPIVQPERVHLKSGDGRSIPMLVWRSPVASETNSSVLIEVHGGPHLQSSPEWDAARQFLLNKGVHIVSVDYRGSAGYGATYETDADEPWQVNDISSACDYAVSELHSQSKQIALLGSSYGSRLALKAGVTKAGLLAGIVLTATPPLPNDEIGAPLSPLRVFAFHGENDTVCPPPQARRTLEKLLGSDCFSPLKGHWEVFENEGHHFHRVISRAKVYTAVLELLYGHTGQ